MNRHFWLAIAALNCLFLSSATVTSILLYHGDIHLNVYAMMYVCGTAFSQLGFMIFGWRHLDTLESWE
jgi:hypothetical protein